MPYDLKNMVIASSRQTKTPLKHALKFFYLAIYN